MLKYLPPLVLQGSQHFSKSLIALQAGNLQINELDNNTIKPEINLQKSERHPQFYVRVFAHGSVMDCGNMYEQIG